jgi:DNA-binding transcriptional LysR family regulator
MLGLREIEAFRVAMTSGSFSAAARLLNTSQPNVTRLIVNMERKLGYPLFLRRSRGVTPTAEAEILYGEVERSFQGLGAISRVAEEIGQFRNAHLSIGALPAMLLEIVPQALAEWQGHHGDLSFTVEPRESERIIHWVRARRFDLGLASPILDTGDIDTVARRRLPYVAMAAPGTGLIGGCTGPIDLATLATLPLIVPSIPYFLAICSDPDLRTVIRQSARMDAFGSQTAALMAMEGVGIALADPFTARYFRRRFGAVVQPVERAPCYEIALFAPRHPVHARVAIRFGEMLSRAIAAV